MEVGYLRHIEVRSRQVKIPSLSDKRYFQNLLRPGYIKGQLLTQHLIALHISSIPDCWLIDLGLRKLITGKSNSTFEASVLGPSRRFTTQNFISL